MKVQILKKITGVILHSWFGVCFLFFLVVSAYLPHSKLIKISSYKKENLEAFRFPGHVKRLARFQCTKNLWYTACYSPKEPETTKRPNWTDELVLTGGNSANADHYKEQKHLSHHHLQKRVKTPSDPRPSSSLFRCPKRNFRYHNPPIKYNFKNQHNGLQEVKGIYNKMTYKLLT